MNIIHIRMQTVQKVNVGNSKTKGWGKEILKKYYTSNTIELIYVIDLVAGSFRTMKLTLIMMRITLMPKDISTGRTQFKCYYKIKKVPLRFIYGPNKSMMTFSLKYVFVPKILVFYK